MTATTVENALRTAPRARLRPAELIQRHGALLTLALVCIAASIRYEAFATPENLLNVLRQNSMLGIMALGMTFVIVMGGVDLSVGSLLAVAAVVAAKLTPYGSLLAISGAVALTTALGVVNGLVIVKARIQPFITTLATMIAARGAALAWTHDASVKAARDATLFKAIGRGTIGPIPVPVVILFAAFGIGALVLGHTRFGRHVYAVGDNEEAARLMGLDVARVNVAVYALSGALAGFAGVMLASRLGAGQPVAGSGWELDAIAAVVVGGTLLTGGQGGAGATLVGVLLLGVLFNIFNLEGTISSWWQFVLRGAFLLTVIVVQNRIAARRRPAA